MIPEAGVTGGDGSGSGQGTGSGTPPVASPPSDSGGVSQGNQGQQSGQQASAQGTGPANTGNDARDRGILADLQKERKARQALEARITESETRYKAEIEAERRRVQALAGITPQSPEEVEDAAVRARFAQLYPDLVSLTKEDIAALRETQAQQKNYQEATQSQWNRHGRAMLGSLGEKVASEVGGTLTERQSRALNGAYIQAVTDDPELLKRHEDGDETFIEEFAKNWIEDWFEPARKIATTSQLNRSRPVPSGRGNARPVVSSKPKIDFNNPTAVEDAMVASFQENGGVFGPRR